ncbi:MAG: hypothetical protein RLZ76_569 [Bacteroidota bacterium]|jgi:hypothetical protein
MKMKLRKHAWLIMAAGLLILSILPGNGSENRKYAADIDPAGKKDFNMLWENIAKTGAGISEEVFTLALRGFSKLQASNRLSKDSMLAIVDFSKSSREKRLYIIDLKTQSLKFESLVSHGRNSGEEFATDFSNQPNSHKSSLGFYITKSTYTGNNGYSLRLQGVEKGYNDLAEKRAIVMHGAPYAENPDAARNTYLGRSFGCPAVPMSIHKSIIQTMKEGNCLFIYYPDKNYLNQSVMLNG